jgi:2'-5' RNA ligase
VSQWRESLTEAARNSSRFAVYLIPPYEVSWPVMEIHQMLCKQFGLAAAGRFQVHATVKGFFKKVEGPVEPLVERLDGVFAEQRPFPIHFSGYRNDEIGIGLNVSLIEGKPNEELYAFRERVVTAVRPFIAPDCDFVASDLGNPYEAHITLAFRDIPLSLYDDVLAYLVEAPLPAISFVARAFHFLEFFSEEWSECWWQTLTWRLIKSWDLSRLVV